MSVSSFRSMFMVASCAGAALGCYLVSLRVASERAALEDVETRIVLEQRDLRMLQTEIGTRGRLAQLERWNVKVLALSAPSADQFLSGSFELAKLARPEPRQNLEVPVVLASAPAPKPHAAPIGGSDDDGDLGATSIASSPSTAQLMHQASFRTAPPPEPPPTKLAAFKATPAKTAKPMKSVKLAAADPLAPKAATKSVTATRPAIKSPAKDSARRP